MGFRFRRSIKLLPGLRLNLSKSGVSTSIGGPGATLNVKADRKPRVTVGLPGTGISYTTTLDLSATAKMEAQTPRDAEATGLAGWLLLLLFGLLIWAIAHFSG